MRIDEPIALVRGDILEREPVPRVHPAFTNKDITLFAPLLALALSRATPEEVVTFYQTRAISAVTREVTSGGVFVAGDELHLILANLPVAYPLYGRLSVPQKQRTIGSHRCNRWPHKMAALILSRSQPSGNAPSEAWVKSFNGTIGNWRCCTSNCPPPTGPTNSPGPRLRSVWPVPVYLGPDLRESPVNQIDEIDQTDQMIISHDSLKAPLELESNQVPGLELIGVWVHETGDAERPQVLTGRVSASPEVR